jgi:hypothetical protein
MNKNNLDWEDASHDGANLREVADKAWTDPQVTLEELAAALGGEVHSREVRAPSKGRGPADRSLVAVPDAKSPDGFTAKSPHGKWADVQNDVRGRLLAYRSRQRGRGNGAEAQSPKQQEQRKTARAQTNSASHNGPTQSESAEDDAHPPAFTDEALALRFAEKHADRLRYVAGWSKWHVWSETLWRQDDTLSAFDESRKVCRAASAECNNPKAKAIASAKTVAAVLSLARADRRLAATVEQWDSDNWLLNTPSGTVDLRTGKQRPHRTTDYITKSTAVAPGGGCPMFLRFLAEITAGDCELQSFLQRLFGYALTGSVREHALAFFYGLGANGKSVLLSTASGVLGDYHTTAPIETFTASGSDRHPTEIAGLRGARLVTAIETEEGRRRQDYRAVYAAGLLRVHAAVQVGDRWQSQAGTSVCGRSDPPPLQSRAFQRHHPDRQARQRTQREAESGVVGDPAMDD